MERSRTEDTEGTEVFGTGRLVGDGFWRLLSRLTGFHAACGTDRSRRRQSFSIVTLLQANAPEADWSVEAEKDSTGRVWWYGQVKRDPFAYQAKYTEDNVVGIFTRADLEMVNAKKALQSQDL